MGSLLVHGAPVRLSGQDSRRGTSWSITRSLTSPDAPLLLRDAGTESMRMRAEGGCLKSSRP
jgi:hypothetical protein